MFGLSMLEIVVIMVVALLVFGPKQLPEIARSLGHAVGDFRRAMDEMRSELKTTDRDFRQIVEPNASVKKMDKDSGEKSQLPAPEESTPIDSFLEVQGDSSKKAG